MEIKNSSIIISGGGSGMGAATAELLSCQGANVVLLDINIEAAKALANKLQNTQALACDVTKEDEVARALDQVETQQGPIRVAINCAGIIHSRRMVNQQGIMPLTEFRRIIEVNLIGTFNLMSQAAARMIKNACTNVTDERGVIINTASVAAYEGQIGQTAYSASKGGITSLTLPAARELGQFGIRVMTIAPGLVETPMFSTLSPETKLSLINMIPFPKRLAYPSEYAQLVKHIIENQMLNGEVIRLDGALRMQAK